jgi:hypothetical protein
LPVPDAPEVTVSQGAPLTAVHVQSARVVTATGVPAPPAAVAEALVGTMA